jgi:hypothetical protein
VFSHFGLLRKRDRWTLVCKHWKVSTIKSKVGKEEKAKSSSEARLPLGAGSPRVHKFNVEGHPEQALLETLLPSSGMYCS